MQLALKLKFDISISSLLGAAAPMLEDEEVVGPGPAPAPSPAEEAILISLKLKLLFPSLSSSAAAVPMLEDEEEFVLSPALISSLNQPVSLILVVSADTGVVAGGAENDRKVLLMVCFFYHLDMSSHPNSCCLSPYGPCSEEGEDAGMNIRSSLSAGCHTLMKTDIVNS